MELNALTRWQSIGKSLYLQGKLHHEIHRLNKEKEKNALTLRGVPDSHVLHALFLYYSLRRFSKGFLVGYVGRLSFAIFGSILKSKGNLRHALQMMGSALIERESISYGAFLGTFLAVFEQIWRGTKNEEEDEDDEEEGNEKGGGGKRVTFDRSADGKGDDDDEIDGDDTPSPSSSPSVSPSPSPRVVPPPLLPPSTLNSSTPFRLFLNRDHRVIVGSVVSSLLALSLIPSDSRMSISVFFLCRAIEIVGKVGVRQGYLPHVPHADTLLMSLASAQVIWSWLFCRDTLELNYLRFLDHQGGREGPVRTSYAGLAQFGMEWLSQQKELIDKVNAVRKKGGFPSIDVNSLREVLQSGQSIPPYQCNLACNIIHPNTKYCTLAFLLFLRAAYRRALPVYGPVFIIPLLIFRWKALLHRPVHVLTKTSIGIARSSLFLSLYCAVSWIATCVLCSYFHHHSTLNGIVAGTMGGLMVSVEKKDRRIELALYVLAQAIPAFFRTAVKFRWLPSVSHMEFPVFAMSMCVIMQSYIASPDLLRPSYWSLLRFFFGSGGQSAKFHTKKQITQIEKGNEKKKDGEGTTSKGARKIESL